jgi:hypothetical protein
MHIEDACPFRDVGQFEDGGLPECDHCIFISGPPMLFHGTAREFEDLACCFILLRLIFQLHHSRDRRVSSLSKQLSLGVVTGVLGEAVQQPADGIPVLPYFSILLERNVDAASAVDFHGPVNLGSSTLVSALEVRGQIISPYGANAFGSNV